MLKEVGLWLTAIIVGAAIEQTVGRFSNAENAFDSDYLLPATVAAAFVLGLLRSEGATQPRWGFALTIGFGLSLGQFAAAVVTAQEAAVFFFAGAVFAIIRGLWFGVVAAAGTYVREFRSSRRRARAAGESE